MLRALNISRLHVLTLMETANEGANLQLVIPEEALLLVQDVF